MPVRKTGPLQFGSLQCRETEDRARGMEWNECQVLARVSLTAVPATAVLRPAPFVPTGGRAGWNGTNLRRCVPKTPPTLHNTRQRLGQHSGQLVDFVFGVVKVR